MKKVVLFTAVLLLAGAVSLSAEAPKFEPSIALTGSASFTFGIEIADAGTDAGITNAIDNELGLTLVPAGTDEKGGKEGEQVYGWIKLKDFKVVLDNDAGDTVTNPAASGIEAKLFLGPVFIDVIGDQDTIDEAGNILGATTLAATTTTTIDQPNVALAANDGTDQAFGTGIHIGLVDTSVISLVVGVQSVNSYNAQANAGSANGWDLFAKLGLTAVPDLTAEALFNYSTASSTDIGIGGKLGYALTLAEGYKLGLTGGIDVDLGSSATTLQVTGELALSVPGSGLTDEDYFGATDIDIKPGLDAIFSLKSATASSTDLGVYFYDADMIPVINLFAALELTDLGGTAAETGIGVRADVTIEGGIAPFAEFYMTSNSSTTLTQFLKVGVNLTMVTNTTFTLQFVSGNFALASADLGDIEFTTKIAY
jgi:hypothetical protein